FTRTLFLFLSALAQFGMLTLFFLRLRRQPMRRETSIAPKSRVNTMPYFFGAGLSYQGLIPGRGNDTASIGFIYGTFSRYIPETTAERVIEANYQITLKRWLSITPDLQYIIRPNGSSAIQNAFVLGTQIAVNF